MPEDYEPESTTNRLSERLTQLERDVHFYQGWRKLTAPPEPEKGRVPPTVILA